MYSMKLRRSITSPARSRVEESFGSSAASLMSILVKSLTAVPASASGAVSSVHMLPP